MTTFEEFMAEQMGRPPCPPWCDPDECCIEWHPDPVLNPDRTGWSGLHSSAVERLAGDEGVMYVRLDQGYFDGVLGPVLIAMDGNADPRLTAEQAEQLAAILTRYAERLRAL